MIIVYHISLLTISNKIQAISLLPFSATSSWLHKLPRHPYWEDDRWTWCRPKGPLGARVLVNQAQDQFSGWSLPCQRTLQTHKRRIRLRKDQRDWSQPLTCWTSIEGGNACAPRKKWLQKGDRSVQSRSKKKSSMMEMFHNHPAQPGSVVTRWISVQGSEDKQQEYTNTWQPR